MEVSIKEKEERFINKLINSMVNSVENHNGNKIVFVKHYNTFDLPKDRMKYIYEKFEKDITIFHYDFSIRSIQGPFEPFLDNIKELYDRFYKDEMSVEEFVKKCNVYKPVRQVFESYIKNRDVERRELIIIPEISYERTNIVESVINILNYVSKEHKIIIVLNRIHFAKISTMYLIRKYMRKLVNNNLGLLITYNDVYCVEGGEREEWNKIMSLIHENNYVVDYNVIGEDGVSNAAFEIKEGDSEIFIKKIKLLLRFNCCGQALEYLRQIADEIEDNNFNISNSEKTVFMLEYIYASICESDYITALKYSDRVKSIIEKEKNAQIHFFYYYNLCMLYIYQYGRNIPGELSKAFEEMSVKTEDDYYVFIYKLTMYLSKFRGLKDLFLCDFDFPIEEEFLKEMEERNYHNHLSYFYMFGFENNPKYFKYSVDSIKELKNFNKGLNIAKELNNCKLTMEGYKKCITVCSRVGNYEPMEYYYKLCLETAEDNEDIVDKVDLYNGIGYNMIVRGNYEKADSYFNEALALQLENHNNGMEIAETIYNMAINSFMCGNYFWTDKYMNYVVKIMNALRTQKMKLCSISKIYGIIAVSNFYLGIDYNCDVYRKLLKRIVKHLLNETDETKFAFWDDDLAFYFTTKALIAKRNEEYDKADIYFNRVMFHLQRSSSAKTILYHIYVYEYTDVLKHQNKTVEAERLIKDAYTYYTSNQAENIALEIINRIHNRGRDVQYKANKVDVCLKKITEKQLIDEINRTRIDSLLEEKTRNLTFVSSWQDMLNDENNSTELKLISNAMTMLNSNYGIQDELVIEVIDGVPKALYKSDAIKCDDKDMEYIVSYFDRIRNSCLVNSLDRSYDEHNYLMNALNDIEITSVVGVPIIRNGSVKFVLIALSVPASSRLEMENMLTEQSKIMIQYAFGQLVDTIYRMRNIKEIEYMNNKLAGMNEMLTNMAEHDFLTNMYNRNGLNKIIDKMSEYQVALGTDEEQMAVLYIDLDNFKYFNDTFGHNVGDKILKEFANLCNRSVGSRGYGIRYGGDEFIILIPHCSAEDAVEIATYINEELENDRFYKNVDISKEEINKARKNNKSLSSSVGIAFCEKMEEKEIYESIKKADLALYDVKKSTKNGYSFYSDRMV
ncbi:MAG: GGDEF domain-containing protein [Lachnospiraceae bacterium]|nr:GGDEF domain-containing protein [Lachnospiraceae bacterium]